jgi:hypothetical protein
MMKKLIVFILMWLLIGIFCVNAFAAWDKTIPADDGNLSAFPADCRANWEAIEDGTTAALQITNAKVATGAAIDDAKLATIDNANKVDGSALFDLEDISAGAGVIPDANVSGKVKVDSSDTTFDVLGDAMSSESFQVNGSDDIEIIDEGIAPEMLEGGAASPSNDTYYGKDAGGTMGFHAIGGYKVKADSGDGSPDYLDGKVDNNTIEVNDSDKLAIIANSIGTVELTAPTAGDIILDWHFPAEQTSGTHWWVHVGTYNFQVAGTYTWKVSIKAGYNDVNVWVIDDSDNYIMSDYTLTTYSTSYDDLSCNITAEAGDQYSIWVKTSPSGGTSIWYKNFYMCSSVAVPITWVDGYRDDADSFSGTKAN